MQALNARERVACVYECQLSEMQKQMSDAINKRLVAKQTTSRTTFSIAIDATKVSQLLEISTAFKAIMGGSHPHHMISTIDLDSPTIKNILDRREYLDKVVDIASEVKVAFMVFQKPPPGVSPIVIISARPQSNNECSSFTADIMNAADFVTRQFPSTSMVEDVVTESLSENDCEHVSFHDARFKQGDICKIVHGNEICDVLRFMHKYE